MRKCTSFNNTGHCTNPHCYMQTPTFIMKLPLSYIEMINILVHTFKDYNGTKGLMILAVSVQVAEPHNCQTSRL